jgi:hypothetical protein
MAIGVYFCVMEWPPVRITKIPSLRQLPCGFTIARCGFCGELAFSDEICRDGDEAIACPSRPECDDAGSIPLA